MRNSEHRTQNKGAGRYALGSDLSQFCVLSPESCVLSPEFCVLKRYPVASARGSDLSNSKSSILALQCAPHETSKRDQLALRPAPLVD